MTDSAKSVRFITKSFPSRQACSVAYCTEAEGGKRNSPQATNSSDWNLSFGESSSSRAITLLAR